MLTKLVDSFKFRYHQRRESVVFRVGKMVAVSNPLPNIRQNRFSDKSKISCWDARMKKTGMITAPFPVCLPLVSPVPFIRRYPYSNVLPLIAFASGKTASFGLGDGLRKKHNKRRPFTFSEKGWGRISRPAPAVREQGCFVY